MKLSLTTIIIYAALVVLAMECSNAQSINYSDLQTIFKAADTYKLNANDLVRIAYVESKFKHDAIRKNKNGTIDIGYFQINSVHFGTTCKEFDILNFEGNAMCAAKILSKHKTKSRTNDTSWIGKYHSKTAKYKAIYNQKLNSVPAITVVTN